MTSSGLLHPNNPSLESLVAALRKKADKFSRPEFHLKHLLDFPDRFDTFSSGTDGFFMDYSRQRVDQETLALLHTLSRETCAFDRFTRMTRGEIVNTTEKRAALHTAARGTGPASLTVSGMDVKAAVTRVNRRIRKFCDEIHTGNITAHGRAYTHAVVVGIGGSYLGCQFVYEALGATLTPKLPLIFMPNVDIDEFARVTEEVPAQTTLWIVISKSFTTTETLANLAQIRGFLGDNGLSPEEHIITVTAQGSPGDESSNPVLACFHMFDFIGGRYSVSSAVGGLPLGLAYGFDVFLRFLNGCHDMDLHALSSPDSIPMTAALLSVWNNRFLGYPAQAVIPYSTRLSRLAAHIQQLHMESLGKSAASDGAALLAPSGLLIFGEPGTNAQHSFFQLAHQGPAFPIEFIGVLTPGFTGRQTRYLGVTNHQELWANLLAQTQALAVGRDHEDPAQRFEGNRPSTLIVMDDLAPERIGALLSFYEARTVLEGFILGINPFDQFGVELGKTMAGEIRKAMAKKNETPEQTLEKLHPSAHFFLEKLFKKQNRPQ